jgi:hypothetical protein
MAIPGRHESHITAQAASACTCRSFHGGAKPVVPFIIEGRPRALQVRFTANALKTMMFSRRCNRLRTSVRSFTMGCVRIAGGRDRPPTRMVGPSQIGPEQDVCAGRAASPRPVSPHGCMLRARPLEDGRLRAPAGGSVGLSRSSASGPGRKDSLKARPPRKLPDGAARSFRDETMRHSALERCVGAYHRITVF